MKVEKKTDIEHLHSCIFTPDTAWVKKVKVEIKEKVKMEIREWKWKRKQLLNILAYSHGHCLSKKSESGNWKKKSERGN